MPRELPRLSKSEWRENAQRSAQYSITVQRKCVVTGTVILNAGSCPWVRITNSAIVLNAHFLNNGECVLQFTGYKWKVNNIKFFSMLYCSCSSNDHHQLIGYCQGRDLKLTLVHFHFQHNENGNDAGEVIDQPEQLLTLLNMIPREDDNVIGEYVRDCKPKFYSGIRNMELEGSMWLEDFNTHSFM